MKICLDFKFFNLYVKLIIFLGKFFLKFLNVIVKMLLLVWNFLIRLEVFIIEIKIKKYVVDKIKYFLGWRLI